MLPNSVLPMCIEVLQHELLFMTIECFNFKLTVSERLRLLGHGSY